MKLKNYFALFLLLSISYSITAQVGIGTTDPNKSSMLDITSSNSGLLIPRVSLSSSADVVTIANPAISLLVYNTSNTSDMIPGFYYWDGVWKAVSESAKQWNLRGNTVTAADYFGTNNFFPIVFKVNNAPFANFYPNGGITMGYNATANVNNSIAIGTNSSAANSNEATALGYAANASGYQSLALGHNARSSNNSGVAIGRSSLSSGYLAIGIGYSSNATNNNSTAIGNTSFASGQQATAVGFGANASGQNATTIGYEATTSQANAIVLGSSTNANNKVGIGTNTPDERLHVAGSIKIVDGTQADGNTLVSDSNGKASWKNLNALKTFAEISKTANTTLSNGEIVLGTTGVNQNVTLAANPTKIQVTKNGIYKVTYTVSLKKTSGAAISPEFYLGIYGTEIPGTRTYTTLSNGEGRTVTLSKLCQLNAYQEVSVYSSMSDANTNVIANGTLLMLELVN